MPMFGSLKKSLLAISPIEASFERRKFENLDSPARGNLEEVLRVFISGYNLTLEVRDYERLTRTLEENFFEHYVGFAFEGAGMCCALLDLLAPGKTSRLRTFTGNAGHNHDYIATVGAGFAVARVPYGFRGPDRYLGKIATSLARWVLDRYMEKLDPWVAWFVLDG